MAVPAIRKEKRSETAIRKILNSAANLFYESGYDAVSLRTISQHSGVNVGGIYYYFKSKEEILFAVIERGAASISNGVQTEIEPLLDAGNPLELIKEAIRLHLTSLHAQGAFAAASIRAMENAPPTVHQRIQDVQKDYERFWYSLLQKARRAGVLRKELDLKITRALILSALNATLKWTGPMSSSRIDIDDIVEVYQGVIVGGIAKR